MEYDNEQLEQLLVLYQERTKHYTTLTNQIVECLFDPVGQVLCDLMEVDPKQIIWGDIEIISPLVLISITLEYSAKEDIPDFVNLIAPASEASESLVRRITLGIPLIYVASDYDTLMSFMQDTIDRQLAAQEPPTSNMHEELTTEQQIQAFLHLKDSKGTIH